MYYKKFDFGDVSVHFAEIPLGGKKTTAGMAILPKAVEVDPKQLRPFSVAFDQSFFISLAVVFHIENS